MEAIRSAITTSGGGTRWLACANATGRTPRCTGTVTGKPTIDEGRAVAGGARMGSWWWTRVVLTAADTTARSGREIFLARADPVGSGEGRDVSAETACALVHKALLRRRRRPAPYPRTQVSRSLCRGNRPSRRRECEEARADHRREAERARGLRALVPVDELLVPLEAFAFVASGLRGMRSGHRHPAHVGPVVADLRGLRAVV